MQRFPHKSALNGPRWLAAAVLIAVLGINLLGDGLRDIIDPRSRSL